MSKRRGGDPDVIGGNGFSLFFEGADNKSKKISGFKIVVKNFNPWGIPKNSAAIFRLNLQIDMDNVIRYNYCR